MGEYVLQLRFSSDEDSVPYRDFIPYYVFVNEDCWEEIYDINRATIFTSEKQAREWAKENTTFNEYIHVVNFHQYDGLYDEWVANGTVRRRFDLIDKKLSRPYANEDKYGVLEWWWENIHADDNSIRYEDYKSWPKLHDMFEHLWNFSSFYNIDTGDVGHTIEVSVHPNSEYSKFKEELDLVLPRLEQYRDIEGELVIEVFDHYLSEYGNSVVLVHDKNGKWSVCGGWVDKIVSGTLKDCFLYLRRERYYEK